MTKLIPIATATLVAALVALSANFVEAGYTTDNDGNLYGTTTFTGSDANDDPDATVDFVVIYGSDGVTLAELNTELGGLGSLAATDDDTGDAAGFDAYDETSASKITFLYQIDSTTAVDVNSMFIKDFGFTPTKTGYFDGFLLSISGSTGDITEGNSGLIKPDSYDDDTSGGGQDGFSFDWNSNNKIGTGESSPVMFAQFSQAEGSGWYTITSDSRLTSGSGSTNADLPSPNPEPGSLALLGAAVAGFGGFRRFRRRRNAEQQPEETEADTATAPEVD